MAEHLSSGLWDADIGPHLVATDTGLCAGCLTAGREVQAPCGIVQMAEYIQKSPMPTRPPSQYEPEPHAIPANPRDSGALWGRWTERMP